MILKKHLSLKSKYINKAMYLAILGLSTLPVSTMAHHPKAVSNTTSTNAAPETHHHRNHGPVVSGKGAFNYYFDDTGVNKNLSARKYGDWQFNKFLLQLEGAKNDFDYKVEHVWYNGYQSNYYHFLETYVGYKFHNNVVGQLGNTKVPFGLMETLSWWDNVAFYSGFGTNYQTGLKMLYNGSPWNFQMQLSKASLVPASNAFSVSPKLTTGQWVWGTGATASSNLNQNNQDSVQLVARITHKHRFNENTKLEVGLSGRVGNTYNALTTHRNSQWAAAVHANAHVQRFNVMFQFIPYRYSPKNDGGVTSTAVPGTSNATMQLGKDGYLYTIPSKANIFVAGLSYKIPVHLGKITDVTVYDDYSILNGNDTQKSTRMNIVGAKFHTGPLCVTADFITAKNMFGIGQGYNQIYNIGNQNTGLDGSDHWKTKINLNIALVF